MSSHIEKEDDISIEHIDQVSKLNDKSQDGLWTEALVKPYIKKYFIDNHGVNITSYFDNGDEFKKTINKNCEWRVNKYTDDIIFKYKNAYCIVDVESTLKYFKPFKSIDSEKKFDDSFYWDIDYLLNICDNSYIEEGLRILKGKNYTKLSFKQLYKSYFAKPLFDVKETTNSAGQKIKSKVYRYIKGLFVENGKLTPLDVLLYSGNGEVEIGYSKALKIFNVLFEFYQKVLEENKLRIQKSICYCNVIKKGNPLPEGGFEIYIVSIHYKNLIQQLKNVYCKLIYTYKLYHRGEDNLQYYNLILNNKKLQKGDIDTRDKLKKEK